MRQPLLLHDTLADFCDAHGASRKRPFPCLQCDGRGWVQVDWGTYYDVFDQDDDDEDCYSLIESPSRVVCQCGDCEGTGIGSEEACKKEYARIIKAFQKDTARYEAFLETVRQAIAKVKEKKRLTRKERAALKEIGYEG